MCTPTPPSTLPRRDKQSLADIFPYVSSERTSGCQSFLWRYFLFNDVLVIFTLPHKTETDVAGAPKNLFAGSGAQEEAADGSQGLPPGEGHLKPEGIAPRIHVCISCLEWERQI